MYTVPSFSVRRSSIGLLFLVSSGLSILVASQVYAGAHVSSGEGLSFSAFTVNASKVRRHRRRVLGSGHHWYAVYHHMKLIFATNSTKTSAGRMSGGIEARPAHDGTQRTYGMPTTASSIYGSDNTLAIATKQTTGSSRPRTILGLAP